MKLLCVTKCGIQLPMIINMSHSVFQQGVLCNFRRLGKSIKLLGLVLSHTHKVGLVNGYPLQYGRLYSRSVKVTHAHHTPVDIAVTLMRTHFGKQENIYLKGHHVVWEKKFTIRSLIFTI